MIRIPCQLQTAIDALTERKAQVILAIDGHCAAGKSTLAAALARQYDCNILPIDHFFLRPEQRTPERLAQVGGNVDYERFLEEVLLPLKEGKSFSYRPYDCGSCQLRQPIAVHPKKLNIIEGTYSLHPVFAEIYDLRVLLQVSADLQRQRILERPSFLHRRFFQEWIPMEKRYLEDFHIAETCDLVL